MREEIKAAEAALAMTCKTFQEVARNLDRFELLEGDNPIVKTDWRPRDETPPKGHIWASDGDGVWLIHSDGEPIPEYAAKVKFWTVAFIPCPPNQRPTLDVELEPGVGFRVLGNLAKECDDDPA